METRLYDKNAVRKEIYFLIIPIILENVFQVSAGVVSAAMIGRLTATIISAQGISTRITGVLYCLFKGIGIGATVIIARTYGEGNRHKCKDIFEQTVITGVLISVAAIIIVIMNSTRLLSFFTSSQATLIEAEAYMKIIIIGSPFLVIMAAVTAAFQGHGNTKTPMYIAIIVNIINICLGYVLIYGKFGFPLLALRGAAIALVISQIAGAFLGLYLLYNERNGIFGVKTSQKFKIEKNTVKEIYSLGIPAAFESMFWQLSAIVMSKVILSYGEATFAAYQLGLQAETITEMPAIGLGVAATALTAKALGQRDDIMFKAYSRQLIKTTTLISLFTSLLLIFLPKLFMSFFTNNVEIQLIGMKYVIAMGFIQLPQNLSKVLNGIMRSAGYKNIPMIISGVGIWVFRVPVSLLVAYVFKLDIVFVWMCVALDQLMKYVLSYIIYKTKKVEDTVLHMDK